MRTDGTAGHAEALGATAMQRLETLGGLVGRPAAEGLAAIERWCAQERLVPRRVVGAGAEHLLVEVPAAQPAFASSQRQALLITARWEPPGRGDGVEVAAACGGVLTVQALAAAGALAAGQAGDGPMAARDLLLSFEVPVGGPEHAGRQAVESELEGEENASRSTPEPPLRTRSRPEAEQVPTPFTRSTKPAERGRPTEGVPRSAAASPRGSPDSRPQGRNPGELQALLARSLVAIAEPGGWPLLRSQGGKRVVIAIGVAQKGRLELRLHTRGGATDHALEGGSVVPIRLLEALDAVRALPRPWTVTPTARAFVRRMAGALGPGRGLALRALIGRGASRALLERLPDIDTELLDALFRESFTITRIRAGGERAEAILDWHTLPGRGRQAVLEELRAALPRGTGIDVLRERPAVEAPEHTPLWRVLEPATAAALPGATVVPMPIPGGCDALGWRQTAIPCYGFAPLLVEGADLLRARAAGAVPVTEPGLRWGTSLLVDVASRFCVEG